ncbi:DUF4870 domain-containing protein [Sorangium sp. So ce321]|uniref:hypothetical protein n=1 Tax=Sorangium sp. So ce321 TaxID=3133300 RepID=UPI003F604B9A
MSTSTSMRTEEVGSQEERMLAGAAYLSTLVGLWVVGPAALYAWKRHHSRLVAFHAVQAVLLNLAMVPATAIALGLVFGAYLGLMTSRLDSTASAVAGVILVVALVLVMGLQFLVTAWMGIAAMRGRARPLPLLGRWAAQILER